jgi:hypothetical protein
MQWREECKFQQSFEIEQNMGKLGWTTDDIYQYDFPPDYTVLPVLF